MYQSAGSAVQSVSVVSPELGVSTLQRGVSGGLGLLDAVPVRLARLVVLRRVLGLYKSWLELHSNNGYNGGCSVV
jgi:hypothetical protein